MSDKDIINDLKTENNKLKIENDNLCKVINILIEKNKTITSHIENKYNNLLYNFWMNYDKF